MHSKKLFAICLALVGVLVLAIGVKLSDFGDNVPNFSPLSSYIRPILNVDSSFFTWPGSKLQGQAQPIPTETTGPNITAKAYLVGNVKSGKIIMQSNISMPMPVASMSKLVTAIAATDSYSMDKLIPVTDDLIKLPPDDSNLQTGEQFKLSEILYPLLISSSNVAAEAIATSTSYDDFMENMRGYAWELGMPTAFFADPSGLSPDNTASANDMFALAQYLYKSRPDILAITKNGVATLATTTTHGHHDIQSTHPFVTDSRFLGGKTGRTPEAGETMLTILNIDNQPIAIIVLGSAFGTREWDTRQLLEQYLELKAASK